MTGGVQHITQVANACTLHVLPYYFSHRTDRVRVIDVDFLASALCL